MTKQTIRIDGFRVGKDKVTQMAAIVKLSPEERSKHLVTVANEGRKAAAEFVRQQTLRHS